MVARGRGESQYQESSLQLRVPGLGLLQDGNVGVGVFPEGEEIFVGEPERCRLP